jgi:hypothetical protein
MSNFTLVKAYYLVRFIFYRVREIDFNICRHVDWTSFDREETAY